MDGNPLKKLVEQMKHPAPKVRSKANRTLSLSEPQFSNFQSYCRRHGRTASEIIDTMIGDFLETVKDDLLVPTDETNKKD